VFVERPVLEVVDAANQAGVRVIVLTSFLTDEHLFPAIRAGALSYLLKDAGAGFVHHAQPAAISLTQATECGTTKQVKATTLKTAANGAYTGPVTPTVTTVYQATYKTVKSAPVSISVRPLLELTKVATGSYSAKATAGQALTGKFVLFQRYKKLKKRWVQVKRMALKSALAAPSWLDPKTGGPRA